VCSAALGASAPTEGGQGRGHTVAAARVQLVMIQLQHSINQAFDKFDVADCPVQGLGRADQGTEVPRQDFYWCMGAILAGCPSCRYE